MINTGILNEIKTRLESIVAGQTSPAGHPYWFTPGAVVLGQRVEDAERSDWPVYSVYRTERANESRLATDAAALWGLIIEVNGGALITDAADPSANAEKAIADIAAAVTGSADSRARNTLGGLCKSFLYESDDIATPAALDQTVFFTLTFTAVLQTKRGNLFDLF